GVLPGFVNNGTLSANGDAGLQVRPGVFTNNGSIDITSNSQLRSTTNTFRQVTGSTTVNGKLNMVDSSLRIEGGTLSGNGTIQFIDGDGNSTTNGGMEVLGSATVAPGDGGIGRLDINPSENLGYSMDIGTTLEIEIGGLLAGTEYDVLNIGGLASLGVYNSGAPFGSGGAAPGLNVTLFDGFVPTVGDTFDILTAIYFQGSFDNNKLSLPTVSGITFEMSYFGNLVGADFFGNGGQLLDGGVRLTAVSAVPVPAAAWLFLSGIAGLVTVTRRRRKA
ncbi:MAG TPA: VPLPA-CTERM sorting domain-containing protein, partial [Gammaproteobacteria bacterium]|nr:VPLPA-CTERM sorting domain-containing protein [Gammaproteobacteria bacterium]